MARVPIRKMDGFTAAERYLRDLCERSFLSMWSYPSVFRDQGPGGKEVCDLLVVFGDDVLLFADKQCAFPCSGNVQRDWSRWFKRAVLANARQIWGAERWIKTFPNRLYLDAACTQRFPVDLPKMGTARFHRIVVAHGVSDRCREELGGNGGLLLVPTINGSDHYLDNGQGVLPFAVGVIERARGFVHVLDDQSLEVTMRTLDTISDFVSYLRRKEEFLSSGILASAAAEQELLAYYLTHRNDIGEHTFGDQTSGCVTLLEGGWSQLTTDPAWQEELYNNRVSYFWDHVIERF